MLPTFISPIVPQELCPVVPTYEKLNHKVGQAILVSGPCALGKQTFSAIASPPPPGFAGHFVLSCNG